MLHSAKKSIIIFLKKNDEIAYRLKVISLRISEFKVRRIDDTKYIIKQYKQKTGQELNLNNPILYNEKLQWIKLYYKNPVLNKCVDKYEVRDFVSHKMDLSKESILIPLIGVYNDINEVEFESIPNSFVMKLTNGSSFNYICYEKNPKEIKKIKSRFNKWIKLDYYALGREWAYKDVKNRIICEELLIPSSGNPPEDFRFFCFNGEVKAISVDIDSVINGVKQANYYRNIYDNEWNRLEARIEYPNKVDYDVPKPNRLDEMLSIAQKLSEDFPAVRVDLYYFDEKIYFGELTFYHSSGYQDMQPYTFAKQMGDWLDLSSIDY